MAVECDLPQKLKVLPDSQKVLDMLASAAGDACFYGCFAAVLYQAADDKAAGLADDLSRALATAQRTIQQMLRVPGYFGEIGMEFLQQMQELIDGLIAGTLSGQDWSSFDFPSATWAFIKSYAARYAREIVLAAIQKMVDELEDMFEKRANRCQMLDQEIQKLVEALESLAGYDWWDKMVTAIQAAKQRLGMSYDELQRIQVGAATGHFDRRNGEAATAHMAVAYSTLSDVDSLTELLDSLAQGAGSFIATGDPFQFSWSGPDKAWRDFLKHLREAGDALENVKDHWSCLIRISHRIDVLKGAIEAAAQVVDTINRDHLQLGIQVDALFGDATVQEIMQGILQVTSEMNDIVARQDRVGAPMYVATWRRSIAGWMQLMNVLNVLPTLPGASGLGLGGMAEDNEGVNELNYMLYPHDPRDGVKSLTEIDFTLQNLTGIMERFIRSTADFARLLGDRDSWKQRINLVRSEIRGVVSRDRQAKHACESYSGNDSDVFDYIYGVLDGFGWKAALTLLSKGLVVDLLDLTINEAIQDSTALLSCLEGISGTTNLAVTAMLDRVSKEQQAYTVMALRSAATLPAYQFRVINLITSQINEVAQEFSRISDLVTEVCGE